MFLCLINVLVLVFYPTMVPFERDSFSYCAYSLGRQAEEVRYYETGTNYFSQNTVNINRNFSSEPMPRTNHVPMQQHKEILLALA